jgi:hypothetical protein
MLQKYTFSTRITKIGTRNYDLWLQLPGNQLPSSWEKGQGWRREILSQPIFLSGRDIA